MHPAAVAGRSEQLATTYIIILCQVLMIAAGILCMPMLQTFELLL